MSAPDRFAPLPVTDAPQQRGDAARNRLPLERLLAYGRARHTFVHDHHALLSDAGRDPQTRFTGPFGLHDAHVRMLLQSAGTTGDLDAQAAALTALFDADYLEHRLADGTTLDEVADAWESVAVKLCGR